MKLLEKIMLATDCSQASNDALRTAVHMAKFFHSELFLVHVISTSRHLSLPLDQLRKQALQHLNELKKDLEQVGIRSTAIIAVGPSSFEQIIQLAEEHDVNVIMLGSREKNETDSFVLGITAERVMRRSVKPVWIVKRGCPPLIKKIVCPVDFSVPAGRALQNAIHLARVVRAELSILNVISKQAKSEAAFRQAQQKKLEDFLKEHDFYNVTYEKEIRQGAAHLNILALIKEKSADLLVMGSVGQTGLAKISLGRVAAKVVREMPCSVITFKSEHAIRLDLEDVIESIEGNFRQGKELMENGFAREAIRKFECILSEDRMFAPAWEGMAEAYGHLGNENKARECLSQGKFIRERLWRRKVEFDIKRQYLPGNKKRT
ncbi:universal stress protein [bacterium]|nr:universal stress protein [bacterium]